MSGRIDFIIPIHRGELAQVERMKKRFDFIEALNDTDGMTYTVVGTYSDPELTVEEIRAVAPSSFFNVKVLKNSDFDAVAKEYNFKIKEHYYPITSVTWELIVRAAAEFKKGEAFHIFHIGDMYPMSTKWAQMLYSSWCAVAKPFIFGEWWYGGVVSGPGPFIDGLYNWKWSEHRRKWGGWGAYDAELPYIAWNKGLSVVPSSRTVGVLSHNFLRRMQEPMIKTDDPSWISGSFNQWISIFHDFENKWYFKEQWEKDTVLDFVITVYRKTISSS